jgi:dystroglycan 1
MEKLTKHTLNSALYREIVVRNVEKDMIGPCQNTLTTPRPPVIAKTHNFPPTVRNPVDRVTAIVGQLLVFEVPDDTFYDPEDQTDLKLMLLNEDRSPLKADHWLQFDTKNKEFFGVPLTNQPHKIEERYVLVAEDKAGLAANDALIVEVSNLHYRQDYSATFEFQLDIPIEQFQNAATKRKFLERVALFFEDLDTDQIVMRSVRRIQSLGRISVVLQNTTLLNEGEICPKDRIRKLRNLLVAQDGSVQDGIKQALGSEFNVQKITVARAGEKFNEVNF